MIILVLMMVIMFMLLPQLVITYGIPVC